MLKIEILHLKRNSFQGVKLICLGQNVMVRSGRWKRGAELGRPFTNHGLGSDCGNFTMASGVVLCY